MILVTGAAGLIGGATVQALSKAGHRIVGLVHNQPEIRGNDRKTVPARAFDGAIPDCGTVVSLRGDIRKPGLGIDPAVTAWLQRTVEVVVHCAALVQFEADVTDLESANVQGTLNVAGLFPRARFVHVSTAYVCGLRDGSIPETACDPAGIFGNGYEQSKAMAETLLLARRPDAAILRPSIVVGEASSGRIRDFDTIYRAFKFIAEGRIDKVPVAASATLNFVPIDHVVDSICELAGSMAAGGSCDGSILHVTAREAVPATRFLAQIGRVRGLKAPQIIPPNDAPPSGLGLSQRLVQPYWGYFRRNPQFETTETARLLGRHAPEMGTQALRRQIEYCIAAGFIRASASA